MRKTEEFCILKISRSDIVVLLKKLSKRKKEYHAERNCKNFKVVRRGTQEDNRNIFGKVCGCGQKAITKKGMQFLPSEPASLSKRSARPGRVKERRCATI